MPAGTLTAQQSAFVEAIVSGLRPAVAYEKVYQCSSAAAATGACRTLKIAHVRKYHDELKSTAQRMDQAKAILSKEQKLEVLSDIAQRKGNYDDALVSDSTRAISVANQMEGHVAPTRTENINASLSLDLNKVFAALQNSPLPTSWDNAIEAKDASPITEDHDAIEADPIEAEAAPQQIKATETATDHERPKDWADD